MLRHRILGSVFPGALLAMSVLLAAQAAPASPDDSTGPPAAIRSGAAPARPVVSAQGLWSDEHEPLLRRSPRATCTLEITPVGAGADFCSAGLTVTTAGRRIEVPVQTASEFLATDVERLVLIDAPETSALPAVVRVIDFTGTERLRREVRGLVGPRLAPDGAALVWGSPDGVTLLDLRSGAARTLPAMPLFAAGPGGLLAGLRPAGAPGSMDWELLIARGDLPPAAWRVRIARPLRLAICPDGATALILEPDALLGVDAASGAAATLFRAPTGARLRDLRVAAVADGYELMLGARLEEGGIWRGELIRLSPQGALLERCPDPARAVAIRPAPPADARAIPWPFTTPQGHPIGNTYGEYQNYGAPYMHPGVDLFGDPGQPVYAVHSGQVKAVLTTSGEWHWRVAVADTATAGYSTGYLYAHLDQPTIAVDVGDLVVQGQYLGDLVPWPIYDFTHCHFARVRASGAQWDGQWICTDNPHLDFTALGDEDPPVFETAVGSSWLAFCQNETSTYLSAQQLQGDVDIIAHVGDRIGTDWVCTVQEIRYSIHPAGQPGQPIIDDKLAVYYDMWLDTYASGYQDQLLVELLYKQDSVCRTEGDYEAREFFHIITNSDGNLVYEEPDLWESWETWRYPNGAYVVEVTARDVAGNPATITMPVQVTNPFSAVMAGADAGSPTPAWRTGRPGTFVEVEFALPRAGRVGLTVHDVLGRQVSMLLAGPLPAGRHAAVWDGRDDAGRPVPAGVYFGRLTLPERAACRRVFVAR